MKKLLSLLLVLVLSFSLVQAIGEESEKKAPLRVATLAGPTGIAMAYMMENNQEDYEFVLFHSPSDLTASLIKGEADIAAVPSNLASVLFNKTRGDVKILSIISRSMLYILEKGDTIHSLSDLEGKTIVTSGQGALPEYVLRYILTSGHLQTALDFKSEHAEAVTLAASGMADVVAVPEPFVTTLLSKNPDFRVALNVGDLFDEAACKNGFPDARLSMSAVVVRSDVLSRRPQEVKKFLSDLEKSVAFASDGKTMAACAKLVVKYEIIGNEKVVLKALPNCNLTFVSGKDMQPQLMPLLQVLFDSNPASVGGKLPSEDFFVIPQ